MENKIPKGYSRRKKSPLNSKNKHKNLPLPKTKKLKYYPIITDNKEQNIIYLAAEDNQNLELNNNIQNDKKITNHHLTLQRSIELKIQNNLNNYINSKDQFISTTKNLCSNENNNSRNKLNRSYSVDNYYNIANKSLNILGANSKITEENFINGIQDFKRKNSLLDALNLYNKYKSLGKITGINNSSNNIIRNNTTKIKTIYNSNKGNNIIIEDENENSYSDTISVKKNNNKNTINNKDCKIVNNYQEQKNVKHKNIQIQKNVNRLILNKINNHKRKKNSKIINIYPIKKEGNKTMKQLSERIFQNNKINEKETEKFIKKSIENEIKKVYKINNKNKNPNLNININNNINNKININNNININPGGDKYNKFKTQKNRLNKKILREEKYLIDENGHKKLLEINQTIIDNNGLNIKSRIKKNQGQKNKIKILKINDKNIKEYYRNNLNLSNNSIRKIRTTYNRSKKENKINDSYSNIKNSIININHECYSRNNKLLSERNQISPNQYSTLYQKSLINNNINNHIFHEIKEKNKKKGPKTIYIFCNNYENKNVINRNHSTKCIKISNNLIKNRIEKRIHKNEIIKRNERNRLSHAYNKGNITYNNNNLYSREGNRSYYNYNECNKTLQNEYYIYQ